MFYHYKLPDGFTREGKAHGAASFYGDSRDDIKETLDHYARRKTLDALPNDEEIRPVDVVRGYFWRSCPRTDEVDVRKIQIGSDVSIDVNLNAVSDLKCDLFSARLKLSKRGPLYKFGQNPDELLYLPQSAVDKLQAYDMSSLEAEAECAERARIAKQAVTVKPSLYKKVLEYFGLDR